ncbi:hypothetical protein [Marixanthomonas ophiurae]|uniref:T9SS C-terminal target domain-containing protein n=1 Tax=Marixanthomonas ophiurae TaxID=387659 RepID=A0A3E1Q9J9_9FLAO|nr:hypothetical protein [Marixanthomonas ophiurae]RFN58805.1 hypothetical protein DZ858_01615 [Marixanthomonas ophiurae]
MKYLHLIFYLVLLQSCTTIYNVVPAVPSNPEDFIQLEDNITTHPRYINDDHIRVIYQENYNDQDGKLEYNIYNQKQVIVQNNITQSVAVKYGTNKLSIPLNNLSSGIYTLEVINEKGVKKYLTFLKSV